MKTRNQAAFPLKHSDDKYNPGMTLRDYFAGQIITGLLQTQHVNDVMIFSDELTERTYKLAEALLIERQNYESQNNR
jgi:hypothetical protein